MATLGGGGGDVGGVEKKRGGALPLKTVDELMELIGWSWYQWRLFFFVGLCVAADSTEVNLLSFLSVEATREWELEEFWEDTVAAAVFMGEVTGCFIFGLLADKHGRLPAFMLGVVFVSVFGLASAAAGSLRQLIVLRFGVGMGIGGFTVPFDLLAESCPAHLRGLVLCALWTFWTFGSVALNIFAAICLRDADGPGQGGGCVYKLNPGDPQSLKAPGFINH
jgi:MFS family permease